MKKYLMIFTAVFLMAVSGYGQDESIEQNTTTVEQISQDSLFKIINASFEKVKPMLTYSCYDCHSDQTEQPWYFNLPVINGFVEGHIKEGREHLDFSTGFPFGGSNNQIHLLEEIKGEVEEGEMPILSYRFMHWGRLIENEKQDTLFAWIDETIGMLKAHGFTAPPRYKEHDED